ncbi:4-(cytidine 5'-diphospho)-2-C-methyl-D-erythritol kinase [Sphingomonas sp. AP4-R1]|uniref:4-(cytidine 5'-diphospho)-2-C-methyl-D-erythritol kinase n=1 Tax=Sphingomonas sp. AP4-R1 TaxID=2735134 RepID=UPI0014936DF4|nr:4-(cytidine 5'-diphospho)-2-C-methyl-D-erythritol kinase [Sphingomonas sp. AP4-R1]QJU59726.1 4-(cytidine 5'-diphospho)-2-C-methyl-D-erythritol kinase [Sphingomonas sp. AP4-R1]
MTFATDAALDAAPEAAPGAAPDIAYAKLNLALHVRSRGEDGYHVLETLFAFCTDGDRLTLEDEPGLRLEGPFAAALSGEGDNLVTRAAREWAALFGGAQAGFRLEKNLPIASGIGGGSADAAAALRLLAARDGIDPADPRVHAIAAGLGADVPACVLSRAARGEGRGEQLVPVSLGRLTGQPVLLVNPGIALSTGAVFKAWDRIDRGALPQGVDAALEGRNDLEAPAVSLVPEIGDVLDLLGAQPGLLFARMSGSGATCFALFEDEAARDAAAAALPACWWRLATRLRP